MNSFSFDTFNINNEEHIEVLNVPNFELYLLATTALSFLIKTEEDESTAKDGDVPQFISYTRWAIDKINELATSKDISITTPEMQPITQKAFACIAHAKLKLTEQPSRLKVGDFEKEFWWFYTEAITELLDSVKILKDEHKKIKGSSDEYNHNTRIQFKHGENTWTYNVRIKDNKGLDIKGFMNGTPIVFKGGDDSDDINQEIITVDFALKNVARCLAMQRGFDFLCNIANKEPTAVSRARTIAIVLGGDYKSYLLSAKHFSESLRNVLNDTTMTEEEAARHILNKQLRASENQITQIISILKPQAAWN